MHYWSKTIGSQCQGNAGAEVFFSFIRTETFTLQKPKTFLKEQRKPFEAQYLKKWMQNYKGEARQFKLSGCELLVGGGC